MSNRIIHAHGHLPDDQDALRTQPSRHGFWHNLWQVAKTIQARLRFIVILAAVGGVLMYWDTLKAHYEKWTRPLLGEAAAASSDTEYWCPMHPTIVRDKPDKCPICGMPLSKRKKARERLRMKPCRPVSLAG